MVDPTEVVKKFEKSWLKMCDSEDGLTVITGLIEMYSLRTSHVPGDPYDTAFRDGQRDVANYLITLVQQKG